MNLRNLVYLKIIFKFAEEQLKIVCLDLLIAGTQTSSSVLGFGLLRVLKSQDLQDKIYKEIETFIGDRMPCWNDSQRLLNHFYTIWVILS